MNFIIRFFIICLISLLSSIVTADENIAYLNVDKIINNSDIGKSVLLDLEKKQKIFLKKFKNIEKNIKEEKKNIL